MALRTSSGNAAADSQWQSYTPTGSWTSNTTYTGTYRLTGNELEIRVRVALSGSPNSALLGVTLPSGFTIDSTAFPSGTAEIPVGSGIIADGAQFIRAEILFIPGISTTSVVCAYHDTTTVPEGPTVVITEPIDTNDNDNPIDFDTGNNISFYASVAVTF